MKLKEILNLNQIIKLIIDNNNLKIDSLLKFRLLGILKDIEPSVSNYETIRNENIREFGQPVNDEKGNIISYEIPQDNEVSINKFKESLEKLLDNDVQITIHKLKVSEVFDKGLPADYLVGLYPIIEE